MTTTPPTTPLHHQQHQQQPREIAPFLKSMRVMLDSESAAVICWTTDGLAFEIHDVKKLTKDVLPKYFKHAKYASFQRQLNYFNFRKWTKSKTEVCTFSNPHFQRDAPLLSWRILRKRSLSDASASGTSGSTNGSTKKQASSPSPQSPTTPSPAFTPTTTQSFAQWPSYASGSGSGSSSDHMDGSASPDGRDSIEQDVEMALHWIDALFPSLEMISSLGDTHTAPTAFSSSSSSFSSAASRAKPRRLTAARNAPMPAQSFEYVA